MDELLHTPHTVQPCSRCGAHSVSSVNVRMDECLPRIQEATLAGRRFLTHSHSGESESRWLMVADVDHTLFLSTHKEDDDTSLTMCLVII